MIKKPMWKIVERKGIKYAEMLLRCHADEYQTEREKIEEYGTVKRATEAILSRFGFEEHDLSCITEEIQRQHEQQLDALKAHLKEHFSHLVDAGSVTVSNDSEAGEIIDDIWETIES